MENLSSITLKELTPDEANTYQAQAKTKLQSILEGVAKDKRDMPDLSPNIKTPDTAPTFYDGKLTLAFAFGGVYAIVKTMPPAYMSVEGVELSFEADGIAFGAGFGGAGLAGSSIYTAQEIAAFGQVHIHFDVATVAVKLNMWTTNMMPIGVWYGAQIGVPVAGGTFGANCGISLRS